MLSILLRWRSLRELAFSNLERGSRDSGLRRGQRGLIEWNSQLRLAYVVSVQVSDKTLIGLVLQLLFCSDCVDAHLKLHFLFIEFLMAVRIRIAGLKVNERDARRIVLSDNVYCSGNER